MLVSLEIQIIGEILQVRDTASTKLVDVYPDQVFSTRGVPFTYDELRGLGNGKHRVNAKQPLGNVGDDLPSVSTA